MLGLRRAPVRGQAQAATTPSCPTRCCTCRRGHFAQHAAGVYAANGIHAHILPDDSPRYLATPELSFAIRHLGAHGGLNISASHNPPDDNGGKFYDERGGQPVPPDDQIMADLVDQVTTIQHRCPGPKRVRSGRIHFLDDEPAQGLHRPVPPAEPGAAAAGRRDQGRLHAAARRRLDDGAWKCSTTQGFRVTPVEEQMQPDGQFPNVTQTPNPEVPESMDRAEALAHGQSARPGPGHRSGRRPPRGHVESRDREPADGWRS